ncbi:Fur family transcriptional regulator [Bacteroides sp. 224]|uniref:Fur family transcriptional regulator n=1 Tax=Bacteroides sp. 224 TaxID=2302936 RepID=UPI0013D5A5AA|nr:transcriptional repressor [Bacteroides sp. 224]NDV65254.1 transcriptional repressor [Bacteroides sp. 224]
MTNIQEIHTYLKSHDIKPTMQRVVIMQYLMEHRTHPTIDEIFCSLSPSIPTLSKATVYNTLKLLYEKNAVLSLTIDEKNVRYDAYTYTHAHFKCKKCGRIYDIPLDENQVPPFSNDTNHKLDETQVYFLGICEHCQD